jgi:hypothetical protein
MKLAMALVSIGAVVLVLFTFGGPVAVLALPPIIKAVAFLAQSMEPPRKPPKRGKNQRT